ncbi:T9SS type A sorting domain-containing protein [Aureispira sp. CCB-QB1]|uniref:T9SS type A sorting domain-containing protein n=1 Tax=Aureispira sp. CCB-QB1 TaxID=1313421 RepID=UPI0006971182|nr:T9SS type A sorting domain-containing protein [Aureispira sp. CCB-QB1]
MKLTFIIICISLGSTIAQSSSPEVLGVAGNRITGTNTVVDWTVGEVFTTTINGTNSMVSQGFHQPHLVVSPLKNVEKPLIYISTFPNPTTSKINVQIDEQIPSNLRFILSSNDGKVIQKLLPMTNEKQWSIDISDLPTGTYFLSLQSSFKTIQSFKITKI